MKSCLLFIIAILLSFRLSADNPKMPDYNRSYSEVLDNLDRIIQDRDIYVQKRMHAADSTRKLLNSAESGSEKLRLSLELAMIQRTLSTDSAIAILNDGYDLAITLKDSISAERIVILRAREYFNRGLVHECFLDLDYAMIRGIHPYNQYIYHDICRIIYFTLGTFNEYQSFDHTDLIASGITHSEQELKLLSTKNSDYYVIEGLINLGKKQFYAMEKSLHKALELMEPDNDQYNIAHTLLGEHYRTFGNNEAAAYHYGMAAIDNIKKARLDEVALLRLGELLNSMNDYTRTHNYTSVSLEQAIQANTKFNQMRISNALLESNKHIEQRRKERFGMLVFSLITLFVLLLVIVKLVFDKRKEVNQLRETEKELARANLAKDTYIGEFMNLCSSYMESLEEYNKLCKRKITTGQTEALMEYIKSGTVLEEQRKKFYDVFDDAFLLLFPNFIENINSLLMPDKQIQTPSPTMLNTELRISAFTRLGFEDSTMISRFLGISINTIYTYRNKMRSRAINRATFDDDIKRIGAV